VPAFSLRRRLWLKLFLMVLALCALLPVGALFFSEPILCVENANAKGDVMVVLDGEANYRPPRVLDLYGQGRAPIILISGRGDCQAVRAFLTSKGVQSAAIELEGESTNTKQNAEFCVRLLRERRVKHAVIVTSWFHSRRALNCFRHYAPEIEFTASPKVLDRPKGHWRDKYERVWVLSEYLKLLGYWVRYGVRPF
jgi:uncharacterized SAM-binding protein YcdF (DUF218 family)